VSPKTRRSNAPALASPRQFRREGRRPHDLAVYFLLEDPRLDLVPALDLPAPQRGSFLLSRFHARNLLECALRVSLCDLMIFLPLLKPAPAHALGARIVSLSAIHSRSALRTENGMGGESI
jgi:hypothetical protein